MHNCCNLSVWVSLSIKYWTELVKILFHAKTYEKCLLTTLTGIFNKISPTIVPLSRSREISHEMTGAILPILSSILC